MTVAVGGTGKILIKNAPERVYSIGNLQKTKFYMGTPKGESTKTAIS